MADLSRQPTDHPDVAARVAVQPLRRQRRVGTGALIGSLVSLFALPFIAGSFAWVPIVIGLLGGLGAISYLVGLHRGPGERALVPGHFRMTEEGFWAWRDGEVERVITPERVATGWCEAGAEGPAVVLRLTDGSLMAVEPPDEASLESLLKQAGLPSSARAERMRLGRDDVGGRMLAAFLIAPFLLLGLPVILGTAGLLVAMLFSFTSWMLVSLPVSLVISALFGLVLWWLGAKLVPSWIRIGTDGVLVQKLFKTFVPYGELRGARIDGGPVYFKVVIERMRGRPLQIPSASRQQAKAVVDQIDSSRDAFQSRRRAALVDGLSRGDQDPQAWRKAVAELLDEGGYRRQALDREHLLQLAEDPGQTEKVRVAAALALQPSARPEDRARIRVAAEASASPKVRVALEHAIEGEVDDETLAALR